MKMNLREFSQLHDFILELCGIFLFIKEKSQIEKKFEPLMNSASCATFGEYYKKIINDPLTFKESIIDAITINETGFFRDGSIFDIFLEFILPILTNKYSDLTNKQNSKVKLWSAGTSSGQEALSLSMMINEYILANPTLKITTNDFEIMATDVSNQIISKAKHGEYDNKEIRRGLSIPRRDSYFQKDGKNWKVKNFIRSMIEYKLINLYSSFYKAGLFDVIFCRYVLIYFDPATKLRIIDQFHKMLSSNGFLILGFPEHIQYYKDKFELLDFNGTSVYKKLG